jgi:hypothetical protein
MLLLQQTPCVVLFLPIFLLKARYDDRKGLYITGGLDTKKSITTCLKLDMPDLDNRFIDGGEVVSLMR